MIDLSLFLASALVRDLPSLRLRRFFPFLSFLLFLRSKPRSNSFGDGDR